MKNPRKKISRQKEWAHILLKVVSGFLLFETMTGLIIFLFPFSLTNQVMVLMHTLAGLIFIIPYLWYQVRHWLVYQPMAMNHFKLSGYILMVITLLLSVSGLIRDIRTRSFTLVICIWRPDSSKRLRNAGEHYPELIPEMPKPISNLETCI